MKPVILELKRIQSFKISFIFFTLFLSLSAFGNEKGSEKMRQGPKDGLSVGAGLMHYSKPYVGISKKSRFIPMISYQKGPFILRGPFISYRLIKWDSGSFGLGLSPLFFGNGYEPEESEALRGMKERKGTVELMSALNLKKRPFDFSASLFRDIIGVHHGTQGRFSLGIGMPISIILKKKFEDVSFFKKTPFTMINSSIFLRTYDSKIANHFFGVESYEQTSNRPAYRPGAATSHGFRLMLRVHFTDNWHFMSSYSREYLPDEIKASPIVGESSFFNLMAGVTYHFEDI